MIVGLDALLLIIENNINNKELIKITLGNKRDKDAILKNIIIKPVIIKNIYQLSFTYRNNNNDSFKNIHCKDAITLIENFLTHQFYNADIFTIKNDYHYFSTNENKIKLITKPSSQNISTQSLTHDKPKHKILDIQKATYLTELGVTSNEGFVKKEMQDKWKQINHYIEIVNGIIKDLHLNNEFTVADMGCGKGYLTFALYDFITNNLKQNVSILGVELRADLVEKCNHIATKLNYNKLRFTKNTIQEIEFNSLDILIALHACDTATDDAIFKGITNNAKVIICAPCCHKQIRKQMLPTNDLKQITKYGILLERQAEIVTDSLRAMILELHGYKTKVFDFIATAHTPKNVMITAIKRDTALTNKREIEEKILGLKSLFNIKSHYLETLF